MTGGNQTLGFYDRRRTAIWASRADPRFSWCAYVPEAFELANAGEYRLLVAVHGTARLMTLYREAFAAFADQHRFIVLAPL
ncbi:MAG: alpha/beta hydrolase, partial [Burkholderiaceae bacterium]